MQHDRRHEPYGWTWEPAAAAAVMAAGAFTGSVQLGRAIARAVTGYGWRFPPAAHWFTSIPGILRGDAGVGLPNTVPIVDPVLLGWCVAAATAAVLVVLSAVAVSLWRRFGPRRLHGAASAAEVRQMLGEQRLRQSAPVIRPDLYPAKRSR